MTPPLVSCGPGLAQSNTHARMTTVMGVAPKGGPVNAVWTWSWSWVPHCHTHRRESPLPEQALKLEDVLQRYHARRDAELRYPFVALLRKTKHQEEAWKETK